VRLSLACVCLSAGCAAAPSSVPPRGDGSCLETSVYRRPGRRHASTTYWHDGEQIGREQLEEILASYPPSREAAARAQRQESLSLAGFMIGATGILGGGGAVLFCRDQACLSGGLAAIGTGLLVNLISGLWGIAHSEPPALEREIALYNDGAGGCRRLRSE